MIESFYKWLYRYRLHVLIWTLYITYEISVAWFALKSYGTAPNYIFHYSLIITIFYLHALVAMPWALRNPLNSFWSVPAVIALQTAIYVLLSFYGDTLLLKWNIEQQAGALGFTNMYILRNSFRAVYFMCFSTGYYFLLTFNQERRKSEELERQKFNEIISRQKAEQELTRAQNAFLKAQINPHFLFNTLDFIYHNILALSPIAADAIITLAEMMRFAIDADKMGEFILLGDELDQVVNLRYLNQLRKNEETAFKLSYSEEIRDIKFIPLVLLTLTENIFKHGVLGESREATLDVFISDDILQITSSNMSHHRASSRGHQTGLANLEKRLLYAYGDAAVFQHGDDGTGHFRVSIKVPLHVLRQRVPTLSA